MQATHTCSWVNDSNVGIAIDVIQLLKFYSIICYSVYLQNINCMHSIQLSNVALPARKQNILLRYPSHYGCSKHHD